MLRPVAVGVLAVVLGSACHIDIPQPPPAPPPLGSATDVDGNVYATVVIGNQEWMASNLKATRYRDGAPIALVEDATTWAKTISPGYSWYDNDIANRDAYGALYNWYTLLQLDEQGRIDDICPTNFGLSTHEGWAALGDTLGGVNLAGGALKEAGTSHWDAPNAGATNSSGFTALPAGQRNLDGTFDSMGQYTWWWCSDQDDFPFADSWFWSVHASDAQSTGGTASWTAGHSIRCFREVTPN